MGVSRRPWALFCLLSGATLAAYWPALHGAFIWNDTDYVTQSSLRSLHGLWLIWSKPGATEQYYPLLHSAFWVEHRLWGDSTLGYHLANVLFHVFSACLLVFILRRLCVPGALLAGALFALHPVAAESVAWISEQKNTLSTLFYLTAFAIYLGTEGKPRSTSAYLVATLVFFLALLTKTVTATLPAALLVVMWWRRGRLGWKRDVVPLIPWFALGGMAGLFSAWVERRYVGAVGPDFVMSWAQRTLVAGRSLWFYLEKLFWPAHLIFIYPRWTPDPAVGWQWLFPAAALFVTALLWSVRLRSRAPLAAWLLFAGSLFPVLGFFNVYAFIFSFVADHFQYLACIGVLTGAAAILSLAWTRWVPRRPQMGVAAGSLLVAVLGILTWRQTHMYRNLSVFYQTILEGNPACWMADNNLGNVLRNEGRKQEAIGLYEAALRLRPAYPEAHLNLGLTLADTGHVAEAIAHDEEALMLRPVYPAASNNLGNAFVQAGRFPEAIAQFEAALRVEPDYADAHYDLGVALLGAGRMEEAMREFEVAVKLDPLRPESRHNYGDGLLQLGRPAEAKAQFSEALRLRPDYPESHNGLGSAFFSLGQVEEARKEFAEAIRLKPAYPEAHNNLGNALAQLGRLPDSVAQFQEALRLKPNYAEARNNLGISLYQMGRVSEAAEQFGEALRLMPGSADAHNNYANVLRQLGRLDDARSEYEEALRIRPDFQDARDNLARLGQVR